MNKVLLTMTAVGALAAAAPAAAQYNNANAGGTVGFSNRIAQLDARLQAGIRSGDISSSEARTLRSELRQLSRLERQYGYNGFTQAERRELQTRLRNFREELRVADNGRFDRDNRYGSWNDDVYNAERYDRYGARDDRYGEYDRNGNYIGRDNGYYGQGGPDEPVDTYCENRGGIGGVIDNVLGRDNCTGYRVGSRVSGNLGSVPSQYRYQYRDGNGVYYRSDGRNIYQIDARTDTVLRIYSMDR